MAEIIQICSRGGRGINLDKDDIKRMSERFLPDNFSPDPPEIIEHDEYVVGVLNPRGTHISEDGVALGTILRDNSWTEINSDPPEGSYAIFRNGPTVTELISDMVGSRTIWYGYTDDVFIASTLQRAIVYLLGQFTPNQEAQAWMFSAGMLGPYHSWATEVQQLPPNAVLSLDRNTGEWNIKRDPIEFDPVDRSRHEHYSELVTAIDHTFEGWTVSPDNEVLTLSGGYDSRLLLHHLAESSPDIRAITWGTPGAQNTPKSDADIAGRLAQSYNVDHSFKTLVSSDTDFETIFQRFVEAGEGRIDHLSGYVDGFSLWQELHSDGIDRIIRGDEGFGWIPPITPFTTEGHVRHGIGLNTIDEYSRFRSYELPDQQLPDYLYRRSEEDLGDWRDRLYHEVRIPVVLAALNGLKSPYVELSNPLLSSKIISCVRRLPRELRDDKTLFKQYVSSISPDIPYAEIGANPPISDVLHSTEAVAFLREGLQDTSEMTIFPEELVDYIRRETTVSATISDSSSLALSSVAVHMKQKLPRPVVDIIKRLSGETVSVNENRLALRLLIIQQMNELLKEDSSRYEL